ncbi:MAG: MBL fold metallo-hydrolase [Elusimicrobia bacterium]|nr:MBL fold metallo-hydrolase [Elusimicrobiota bacterium]
MRISFYGGADEVTGSRHFLEADGACILMDCGLFQGHRRQAIDKNRQFPFRAKDLSAVLLSHAHIDHSGTLPLLAKTGFSGAIYSTGATQDLCNIMLMDSAHLQQEDAKFFNKIHQRAGDTERIEPLYTQEDAGRCLELFAPQDYEKPVIVSDNVRAHFLNAGHVLGSAMIMVEASAGRSAAPRRLLFSGDLGRRKTILMNPPKPPKNIDYLLIESTYGGRVHDPLEKTEEILAAIVRRAADENGKVLIPSFALERTQEVVFILEKLRREKRIPEMPLYVDSPMAVDITRVFQKHLDHFTIDPEFKDYINDMDDPFGFKTVHYVRSVEESQRLNDLEEPAIIISASGMCEGGRILHHLRNHMGKETTTILLVGYQAHGTLGRRLMEGATKVKIFGLEHDRWARIVTLHTLSSHADKNDLIDFIERLEPRPRRIFLVHGDPEDRLSLAGHLKTAGIGNVEVPKFGDTFELD